MAPSLSADDVDRLFDLAEEAILAGLDGRRPPTVDLSALPACLREGAGVFVTINVGGELNGCTGTLDDDEPLAVAVSRLAHSSAFSDPRLPPLQRDELRDAELELSVLSRPEPMDVSSIEDLRTQLQPGTDGLLITSSGRRATFLPAVWDHVADVDEFLRLLWLKAGLRPGSWPARTTAWRYRATEYARRFRLGQADAG